MRDPEIHSRITFTPVDFGKDIPCPRCHRTKALGTCDDGCKMCQSCFHAIHNMGPLPSDSFVMKKETELKGKIHDLLAEIFKNPKKGYSWLNAHFFKDAVQHVEYQEEIYKCVLSKKEQTVCPVHIRVHGAPKK